MKFLHHSIQWEKSSDVKLKASCWRLRRCPQKTSRFPKQFHKYELPEHTLSVLFSHVRHLELIFVTAFSRCCLCRLGGWLFPPTLKMVICQTRTLCLPALPAWRGVGCCHCQALSLWWRLPILMMHPITSCQPLEHQLAWFDVWIGNPKYIGKRLIVVPRRLTIGTGGCRLGYPHSVTLMERNCELGKLQKWHLDFLVALFSFPSVQPLKIPSGERIHGQNSGQLDACNHSLTLTSIYGLAVRLFLVASLGWTEEASYSRHLPTKEGKLK